MDVVFIDDNKKAGWSSEGQSIQLVRMTNRAYSFEVDTSPPAGVINADHAAISMEFDMERTLPSPKTALEIPPVWIG